MSSGTLKRLPHFGEARSTSPPKSKERSIVKVDEFEYEITLSSLVNYKVGV